MRGLSISEVAKASKVNIATVRYYERCGLISDPPRTESGYRKFPVEIVERIKFIRRSQELGFTLSEIEKLLMISDNDKNFDSEEILQFTNHKIQEIELKIQDLKKIKSVLKALSDQCPGLGNPICKCPIIETLSKGGELDG